MSIIPQIVRDTLPLTRQEGPLPAIAIRKAFDRANGDGRFAFSTSGVIDSAWHARISDTTADRYYTVYYSETNDVEFFVANDVGASVTYTFGRNGQPWTIGFQWLDSSEHSAALNEIMALTGKRRMHLPQSNPMGGFAVSVRDVVGCPDLAALLEYFRIRARPAESH